MICEFCSQEGEMSMAETSRVGFSLCNPCAADWDEWHREEPADTGTDETYDDWDGTF